MGTDLHGRSGSALKIDKSHIQKKVSIISQATELGVWVCAGSITDRWGDTSRNPEARISLHSGEWTRCQLHSGGGTGIWRWWPEGRRRQPRRQCLHLAGNSFKEPDASCPDAGTLSGLPPPLSLCLFIIQSGPVVVGAWVESSVVRKIQKGKKPQFA